MRVRVVTHDSDARRTVDHWVLSTSGFLRFSPLNQIPSGCFSQIDFLESSLAALSRGVTQGT